MKVFIYHCPDAPEHHRYVGRMLVKGAGSQGGSGFLPVIANGATAEIATQKLTDLWNKNGEAKLRKRGQLQPVNKGVGQTDTLYEDAGLDADGLIPGDKGATPVPTTSDDDLDDLLG